METQPKNTQMKESTQCEQGRRRFGAGPCLPAWFHLDVPGSPFRAPVTHTHSASQRYSPKEFSEGAQVVARILRVSVWTADDACDHFAVKDLGSKRSVPRAADPLPVAVPRPAPGCVCG